MATDRERYLGICRFERPGDLFYSDGFWSRTLSNWIKEGAPAQLFDGAFRTDYFGYGRTHRLSEIRSGISFSRGHNRVLAQGISVADWGTVPLMPSYEPRIIAEDERTVTIINGSGQTAKLFRGRTGKMPMFIDYPVKDRATWNEYKKRLDPATPERYPEDWDDFVQRARKHSEELAIVLEVGSFFGLLREWMGTEALLYLFYDDPALVEDMMDTMLDLESQIVDKVVKEVRVDQASYWEDMCYKTGPMISPAMFEKYMAPRYRKLNELLRGHGIDIIYVDSDGNVDELLPLWVEAGINLIFPLEVAAGMDALAVRKKYGKSLAIQGAIDKRALIKGPDAIREEVTSKLPPLLAQGGYIVGVDHSVPPDVTFENYCCYINTMREVAGLEQLEFERN